MVDVAGVREAAQPRPRGSVYLTPTVGIPMERTEQI